MSAQDRLFRLLLRLYPAEFRSRYGDELLQLCADEQRDAQAPGARRGPLRTLLATLIDVTWSGLVERASNGGAPAPTPAMRVLGLLGIAGGLILVSAFAFFIPGTFNLIRLALFNVGAIAIAIAMVPLAQGRVGRWALAPAVLVVVSNAAYLTMTLYTAQFEHPFAGLRGDVYGWVTMAMWLGDGLFGLTALRLGGPARLGGISLALGGFGILGMDRFWEPSELASAIALAGVALNGIGWILLGLVVAFRHRPVAPLPAGPQRT